MDYITLFAVACGLSFDTFAVSLTYGVVRSRIIFMEAVRIAIVLAFVQGAMAVLGYFMGSIVSDSLRNSDHWVVLGLLSFLGIRMIMEGLKEKEDDEIKDYRNFFVLLSVGVVTSIDAFAVGISFALIESMVLWVSAGIIAIVTFIASMTAIRIGKAAGERLGRRVEIIGGIVLILAGIKIFLEHILG
jgi:putative Mn2+ efflux pump MntP